MRIAGIATLLACLTAASPARATFFSVNFFQGELARIDETTGAVDVIGATGYSKLNSLARRSDGALFSMSVESGVLIRIDPKTGSAISAIPLGIFGAVNIDIRALAFSPDDTLYAVNKNALFDLVRIDPVSGIGETIGVSSAYGVQSLDFGPDGLLYGWDFGTGLTTFDLHTGALVDVSPADDDSEPLQSIAFAPDGTLYASVFGSTFGRRKGDEIYTIDLATGARTLVATTGFVNGFDSRGMEFLSEPRTTSLTLAAILGLSAGTMRRRRATQQGAAADRP